MIILTLAAPKHQGISKVTRCSKRIQSRTNTKQDTQESTEQEARLRWFSSLSKI